MEDSGFTVFFELFENCHVLGIFEDYIIVMVRLDERVDDDYTGFHGIDISLLRLFFQQERTLKRSPEILERYSTPCRNRTCDTRFRKPVLYPTELRGRKGLRLIITFNVIKTS